MKKLVAILLSASLCLLNANAQWSTILGASRAASGGTGTVTFDSASNVTVQTTNAATTLTFGVTNPGNSNQALIVFAFIANNHSLTVSSAVADGVSMSLVDSGFPNNDVTKGAGAVYQLTGATLHSGTWNVVVTISAGLTGASSEGICGGFYWVHGSGAITITGNGKVTGSGSNPARTTTSRTNSLVYGFVECGDATGTAGLNGATAIERFTVTFSTGFGGGRGAAETCVGATSVDTRYGITSDNYVFFTGSIDSA